ncbi:unnamed protein product [Sympodiomycopsis kandeliae]
MPKAKKVRQNPDAQKVKNSAVEQLLAANSSGTASHTPSSHSVSAETVTDSNQASLVSSTSLPSLPAFTRRSGADSSETSASKPSSASDSISGLNPTSSKPSSASDSHASLLSFSSSTRSIANESSTSKRTTAIQQRCCASAKPRPQSSEERSSHTTASKIQRTCVLPWTYNGSRSSSRRDAAPEDWEEGSQIDADIIELSPSGLRACEALLLLQREDNKAGLKPHTVTSFHHLQSASPKLPGATNR